MRLYANQPAGTVTQLRTLRRNATEAEKRLLRALKEAFPTRKWRFQAPLGPYRVDVLCFSERLVIEIDGGQHAEAAAYDAARTRFIEREGYRVLRFWNNDVMDNTDGVIEAIRNSLSLWEREGAPKARKGEGDRRPFSPNSPSPSHTAPRRGPLPLPKGEEL
ncbi:endonuclease domain-containing protein [Sphingomonas sp. DT-204]|uniref:endonuclease domain-containing protein n=1 Tax=Sphingomonas sp. DT-204 TaxID=3396166 RepID=UPI003F195EBD